MLRGSRQVSTSRAPQPEEEPMQETNYHEVPPTNFEPALQAAAKQQRLLELKETIQMLVQRNQDMERQFRTEIENLKLQNPITLYGEWTCSDPGTSCVVGCSCTVRQPSFK